MPDVLDEPTDVPRSLFDKLGTALPFALMALATVFAGLSNSELPQAMFWRSYAAQDQSKATSQWTFTGSKRNRSLICQAAAAQLRATLPDIGAEAASKSLEPFPGGPSSWSLSRPACEAVGQVAAGEGGSAQQEGRRLIKIAS